MFGLHIVFGVLVGVSQSVATQFPFGIPKLNHSLIEMASKDLTELIDSVRDDDDVRILIPAAVRLAFHDCAGGCDGCLNMSHPFNVNYFPKFLPSFESVYLQNNPPEKLPWFQYMSRADFWALASIVSMHMAVDINNNEYCPTLPKYQRKRCKTPKLNIRFHYGRKDCIGSPNYTNPDTPELPGAFLDYDGVVGFYSRGFGFNPVESTVISGAHALGETSRERTPLSGVWTPGNKDGFSNQYFRNMVNKRLRWAQTEISPDIWQWNGEDDTFLLDTDLVLLKNLTLNPNTGESSCTYSSCGSSPTAYIAKLFARSQKVFIYFYERAFTKMIETGYKLQKPEEGTFFHSTTGKASRSPSLDQQLDTDHQDDDEADYAAIIELEALGEKLSHNFSQDEPENQSFIP